MRGVVLFFVFLLNKAKVMSETIYTLTVIYFSYVIYVLHSDEILIYLKKYFPRCWPEKV